MKKNTLIWLLIIFAIAISALLYGSKAGWFGNKDEGKIVQITEIAPLTITETVAATGKIQPEIEVFLSSEVSGEIIDLPVKEGQLVEKGQLLVKINPDLIQAQVSQSQAGLQNVRAQLENAEASLKNAKANYNRSKSLFDKGVISRSDWDRSVAEYEMAQANKSSVYYNVQSASASVKQSRDNLNRTKIYSPMTGTISKLSVELGERVVGTAQMAGTEIIRVANLDNMEVEVDVNENDIVKVAVGDSTLVEVDAWTKREFRGLVTEIANSAESTLTADQVTNFKVKVRIIPESYKDLTENKPESYSPFRPGMTATVDVITNKKQDILAVPISAVVIKTDTSSTKKPFKKEVVTADTKKFECVFVVNEGKAKLRIVETGIQDDTNIEIRSGLKEGDKVITGPYTLVTKTLKPGDKVTVEDKDKKDDTE